MVLEGLLSPPNIPQEKKPSSAQNTHLYRVYVFRLTGVYRITESIVCIYRHNTTNASLMGILPPMDYGQVGKAQDFGSCMRWFEPS